MDIQAYYPSAPPEYEITQLREEERKELQTELKSSRYSVNIEEFLRTVNSKIKLSYPNVATLNAVFTDKTSPHLALLIRSLKRVVCLLKKYKCNKHLIFWLIPTLSHRSFPKPGEVLSEIHINGGYTYPMRNTVYIYRFEEFPKVMLHETIHHLPMDTGHKWDHQDLMKLYNVLHIDTTNCNQTCSTDIMPNEAIVETWAEVYHLAFLELEFHIPFQQMLQHEKNWAAIQTKRIKIHQKKYFPEWKENTHAYSYVVIRAALLWNLAAFLSIKAPYNQNILTNLILESISKPDFIAAVEKATIPTHDSFRMTLFGSL